MTSRLDRSLHCSLVAGVLLAGSAASAETSFQLTDLGTLGGSESAGFGLNDLGQVVGWSTLNDTPSCRSGDHPCRHAFLWDDGVMTDLGFLDGDEESVARAINNAGLIAGTSERDVIAGSGTFHGVVWESGVIDPLPDLGQGQSFVHDLNESGQIAGWTQDPAVSRDRAVTWTSGVIANVGDTAPYSYSRAIGLNDSGVLIGFAWNLFQPNDAILHDGASWFTIGGEDGPFQNAEGTDVNNTGLAVGFMAHPSGSWHATIWNGGPGVDLGTLPGMDTSELYDVNDAGQAVGRAYADFNSRAIYYDGKTLHDLNDFVPTDFPGVLFEAREINENGDIVGTALVGGVFHAFLMTVTEACPADLDGSGDVGFTDLVALLSNWGTCIDCPADFDGSGDVGFTDLVELLSAWGPCAA